MGQGRPGQERRAAGPQAPDIPEDITAQMLDRDSRRELLTLSKTNGSTVARHLVMAGILLEEDPESAYEHAQAAGRGAGRVAVAREAVAITSYATGRFAEALKELRAVRRLSGRDDHRVMEADCERGLGRPERALVVIAETDTTAMPDAERAELAIVASGARADLGENEAGLLLLRTVHLDKITDPAIRGRLDAVIADRLDELGRGDEAAEVRSRISLPLESSGDALEVIDLLPDEIDDADQRRPGAGGQSSEASPSAKSTEPTPAPAAEHDDPPAVAERGPTPEPGADSVSSEPASEVEPGEAPELESELELVVEPGAVVEVELTAEPESKVEPEPEPELAAESEPEPESKVEADKQSESEQGQLELDLGFESGIDDGLGSDGSEDSSSRPTQ